MLRYNLSVGLWLLSCLSVFSQNETEQFEKLGFTQIKGFTIESDRYSTALQMMLPQAVDHEHSNGKTFNQRVFIRHRGYDRPTVLVTEGYVADYALYPRYDEELAKYLDANLVVVEHRYFGKSTPETKDWKNLTLVNEAADLHAINQKLRSVYTGPWISTGISKGGQTTLYYRYFYPNDVEASVPYVAPLNFSVADRRVYHFKDTVATQECRQQLLNLQRDLLRRKVVFEKMFADSCSARGFTFIRVGGIAKAFEYNVLEFGFAYWQWYPISCGQLPEPGGDSVAVFNAFIAAAGYDFFADQSLDAFEPFFYQALTEMGFYSYRTKEFKDLLTEVKHPGFSHALPEGVHVDYHKRLNRKVNRWLKKEGDHILYVYGGYDAWSSTAVQPGTKTNARKFVLAEGSHATRLRHFEAARRNEAIGILQQWISE